MSGQYAYLGSPRGAFQFVFGRWIQSINVYQPEIETRPGINVVACRLAVAVHLKIDSPQVDGELSEIVATTVLRESDGRVLAEVTVDNSGDAIPQTDLAAWYRSQDLADTGGGETNLWIDASGNGEDLTAPGDSPNFLAAWRNGRNAIQGDGIFDSLSRATFTGGLVPQPATIYFCGAWPSNAGAQNFVFDGVADRRALYRQGTSARALDDTTLTLDPGPDPGDVVIVRVIFDGSSSAISVFRDGLPTLAIIGNTGTTSADGLALFSAFNGGGKSNAIAGGLAYYRRRVDPGSADDVQILNYYKAEFAINPA